ncbi:hypothetical protein EGW08_022874 [Elysia chlorotica]|uniref:Uncharacterized protein n=1 Tax=Elysia chlorotica TaxID=188477 RepID=A0A433SK64_ELYCH|nr:hypothetical protein EGW08_022874 [Elysia chlorotica]
MIWFQELHFCIPAKMVHYHQLAVLIAVYAAMCEAGLIRRQAESMNETYEYMPPYSECHENRHELCLVQNLDQYASTLGSRDADVRNSFMSDRSNLENVAESLLSAKTCLQNQSSQVYCQNVTDKHDKNLDDQITLMADFMASPEHIDLLVAVTSSTCATSQQTLRSAKHDATDCLIDLYQKDMTCATLNTCRVCITNVFSQKCGPEAAALVSAIWDYAAQSQIGRNTVEYSIEIPASLVDKCYTDQN